MAGVVGCVSLAAELFDKLIPTAIVRIVPEIKYVN